MKQTELIENEQLRTLLGEQTELLDVVGHLKLIPTLECATHEQVSEYYGVNRSTLERLYRSQYHDELIMCGVQDCNGKELQKHFNTRNIPHTNHVGHFIANDSKYSYGTFRIYTKRTILRMGMLLPQSEVAKQLRNKLMSIRYTIELSESINNIEQKSTRCINIDNPKMDEERQLRLERVEAELNGDVNKVSVINTKLFNLKTKKLNRLKEQTNTMLEEITETTNKLKNLMANYNQI